MRARGRQAGCVSEERMKKGVERPRSCILRADRDRLIADLAGRQAGRVSRRQLLAAGVSHDGIKARLRSGRLISLHHGVYALGHRSNARARHWGALLAVGDDGAISHMSAMAEHRLVRHAPIVVDVTIPRRLAGRDGVRVHVRALEPASLTAIEGLPVTTPAQTLFDLATMLGTEQLTKIANEAFVQRLVTTDDLHATLGRNRSRKGASGFGGCSPASTRRGGGSDRRSRPGSTRSCVSAAFHPGSRTPGSRSAVRRSNPMSSGAGSASPSRPTAATRISRR